MVINYHDIITIEHGKACIRNLRITVFDVFSCLANGMTPAEIIKDYPELTVTDIQACFSYAADREKSTMLAELIKVYQGRLRNLMMSTSLRVQFQAISVTALFYRWFLR